MRHAVNHVAHNALQAFNFPSPTRVVFGAGSAGRAGEFARELGARRVLLVTDPGIVAAGHAGRVQQHLESAGLHLTVFDRARQNPTTKCVEDCVAVARAAGIDTIIGLGGGSSMDTAKGCNFILTNGGRMQDYRGVGKATKPMLPFMAIPTTAGTGSECQSAALIAEEHTHQKMACLDRKCAARIALLDPELTLSQPTCVTACTGVDALAHAVETAVTTKRTALSGRLSAEAFRLCLAAMPEVLRNPNDLDARGRMQVGAALAGAAIEHSMLGAAHAAANPLTARFDVIHGHAVGMMLPHVVRFNGEDATVCAAYAGLAGAAELVSPGTDSRRALEVLVERLEAVFALTTLPPSLAACGVQRADLGRLAEEATQQWTAGFNPRPVAKEEFLRLYEAVFG